MPDLRPQPFADDQGDIDPGVQRALTAYAADPEALVEVLAALQRSRLLVPMVPHPDQPGEMAGMFLQRGDGARALVAFTSLAALRRWNERARPVPTATRDAAAAALHDGAAALLVDVAGPTRVAISGEDLHALAHDWSLVRVDGRSAWIRTGIGGPGE